MAKPPAGASLLFGALADSGRIKQRKNGSYKMVLKGVDEIDWFTDRPDRVAGEWSPKKLLEEWDVLFSDKAGAPNAEATFEIGSKRKLVTFEMFKPKLRDSNQKLSFKVRGIGKKNKDLLTGLKHKKISDASLFIDDGTTGDRIVTLKIVAQSVCKAQNYIQLDSGSPDAVFGKPTTGSRYTRPELFRGVVSFYAGSFYQPDEGTLEVPVTLKNGLTSSAIIFSNQILGECGSTDDDMRPMVNYSVVGGSSGEVFLDFYDPPVDGIMSPEESVDINWG